MNSSPLFISIRAIADIVCRSTGAPPEQLLTQRRTKSIAEARQIIMWLAARHTNKSRSAVGRILGRDHTTVLHGAMRIEARAAAEPAFATFLASIEDQVRALADTIERSGKTLSDIDAEAVAQRVLEAPRGAVRISVQEIEALASAVLCDRLAKDAAIAMFNARTPEERERHFHDFLEHLVETEDTHV